MPASLEFNCDVVNLLALFISLRTMFLELRQEMEELESKMNSQCRKVTT